MVTMVNAKGKGESSTSNSNPNTNEAANPVQTETSASSPIKMNVEEVVVVYEIRDQEENAIEEVKNKENSIVAVRNEGNAIEDEKNQENAHEEDENNEENAMVEGENEENSIEEENATEEKNEENAAEEEKNEEEAEADSKEKVKKSRKSRRKKAAQRGSKAVDAKDKDKPESSSKKKSSKKVESMGMIFMCSSKTKKDCYRYKVLGLPASKRDTVKKIYKGMRLFLFDFDLRLMYGIYKAAGPGGYNIEPKAFKSAFPSQIAKPINDLSEKSPSGVPQVQFTVLEDCLPLSEEKFRKVIKDNYYTRNKFDCQLTSEQVKNLCKLFLASSKGPKSKKLGRSLREETHTSVDRNRTRRRAGDKERRHSALGGDRRYHEHPVMYEREAFATLVAPLPQVPSLPPPAPAPSYAYERTLERPVYRQDPLFEHRDHELLDLEQRRRDETEHHDPYNSYREPPSYRDPLYSAGQPPEYRLAQPESEYRRLAQPESEYRRLAQPESEYRRLAQPVSEYRRIAQPVSEYRRLAQPESEYRRLAQPESEYRRLAQPVSEYRRLAPVSEYRSAPVLPPEYDPLRPFHRY